MTEPMNLKEIEKKAYRFTFTDGIYDLTYATLLIMIALAPILRELIGLGYILFLVIPAPLLLLLGIRYISVPRIGLVKFNQHRKTTQKKIAIICIILLPLTVILVLLTAAQIFPGSYGTLLGVYTVPIGGALFAIALLSLIAYFIEFSHLYAYGLAIGLGILISELLYDPVAPPWNSVIAFGISGTLLFIYGIIELVRFIRTYPLPKEENSIVN